LDKEDIDTIIRFRSTVDRNHTSWYNLPPPQLPLCPLFAFLCVFWGGADWEVWGLG